VAHGPETSVIAIDAPAAAAAAAEDGAPSTAAAARTAPVAAAAQPPSPDAVSADNADGDGDGDGTQIAATDASGWRDAGRDPYVPPPYAGREPPPDCDFLPAAGVAYANAAEFGSALDFFARCFPAEAIALLVTHTNRAAEMRRQSRVSARASEAWRAVDEQEMRALIGTVLLMSSAPMDDIHRFWSTRFGYAPVQRVWSRDRFLDIYGVLSAGEEGAATGTTADRTAAVRELFELTNRAYASSAAAGAIVTIDESMIAFRGDHEAVMMMPAKPIKIGFKAWSLATPSGYILKQLPYNGSADRPEVGLTERVVMELLDASYYDAWRTAVMDSFYTGVPLFTRLYNAKTLAIGVVHPNRSHLPKSLPTKKLKTFAAHSLPPPIRSLDLTRALWCTETSSRFGSTRKRRGWRVCCISG
jgi:hypothetical protein